MQAATCITNPNPAFVTNTGEFINLLRKNELQNTQYAWICEKIKKGLDDKDEK